MNYYWAYLFIEVITIPIWQVVIEEWLEFTEVHLVKAEHHVEIESQSQDESREVEAPDCIQEVQDWHSAQDLVALSVNLWDGALVFLYLETGNRPDIRSGDLPT